MSTNVSFSNKSFQRTVKSVRKVMPILAVILLIVVYLISAVAEGVFLANLMEGFTGAVWLAYGMSGAIQATRALLVFFPQLNPNRPTFGYQGEAIAVVMGLVAIGSVWGVVSAVGLPHPVGISLSILMLAGMGVEIFFLREIRYATELELFSNREHWEEIRKYHQARAELQAFLDQVRDYEADGNQAGNQAAQQTAVSKSKHRTYSEKLIDAIGEAYNLDTNQMAKIRSMMDGQQPEEDILHQIDVFSNINRRNSQNGQYDPLELSALNGNGSH